jgi:hypothetical protein
MKCVVRTLACLAPLLLVLLLARPARADDPPAEDVEDIAAVSSQTRPPGMFGPLPNVPPVHVELSLDHAFHTPLHDFHGTFDVTRDRVEVGTWCPLPGTFFFGLDFEVEASTYDGAWGIVFNDQRYETLWQIDVGPKLLDRLTDKVTLYLGTVFFFCGALDAEVKDAFRFELDLATQIKLTRTATLTAGAGIRTGIETHPAYYPIVEFEMPRFKVSLLGGMLKANVVIVEKEPGVERLDAVASFGYDLREYRLAEHLSGHLTQLPGGVMQDTRYPLSAGLEFHPRTGLQFGLYGGANFFQKIEIDDHLGRALARSSCTPAPFITFRIEIDI